MTGLILKSLSGFYYVETEKGRVECRARGILRKKGITPKVGDRAEITLTGEKGTVESIMPRKNELSRPPVANIDNLYIVVSTVDPLPNFAVIDELSALAEKSGIEPVIVVSKTDIEAGEKIAAIYKKAGFQVFSAVADYEKIKESMAGKISAFTGNTGVGKSTLLNRIDPHFKVETGDISQKLGRGRHTTRAVELYKLDNGGYIADTPGFSINREDIPPIYKDELENCFREFKDYLGSCRFTGCSHTVEKGCAVIEAVRRGEISEERHKSYKEIYNKIKGIEKWQI